MVSIEQLGNIGDAIGGIAVLLSLWYLAREVRANTNSMKATAAKDVTRDWADFNQDMSQHPDRVSINDAFDPSFDAANWTRDEAVAFKYHVRGVLQRFQAEYALAEAGILDAEVWEQHRIYCRAMINIPVFAEWWKTEREQPMFPAAFIEEIESAPMSETPVHGH